MTDHPITPPPELVRQWFLGAKALPVDQWVMDVATCAARWGADTELEACCDHILDYQWGFVDRPDGTKMHRAVDLQLARRPKPPSLKEQALAIVTRGNQALTSEEQSTIRRALEQLDD